MQSPLLAIVLPDRRGQYRLNKLGAKNLSYLEHLCQNLAEGERGAFCFRQVAQCVDNCHTADHPGRYSYRTKCEDHAQAISNHQAARLKSELEREIKPRQYRAKVEYQQRACTYADQQADQ